MGWGLDSIGNAINSIMGTTSAGKQSQKYALQSAQINNQYQKEFAKNAHNWEVQDLKNAGLNPVLSAGGSGTGASGGGVNSAQVQSSGMNPFETAIGVWQGAENALNTGADTQKRKSEINNINQDTTLKYWQTLTEMEKGKLTKAERDKIKAEKDRILELVTYERQDLQAEIGLKSAQTEKEFEQAKLNKRTATRKGYRINIGPFGKLGWEQEDF